jgi:hypothetical protein
MTPLCCNTAVAIPGAAGAPDCRAVRETAKRALTREARQNPGTDDEGENDLARVPAGPATLHAGNRSSIDGIGRATPTRSSDASSERHHLLRSGDNAAARRPTEARELGGQVLYGDLRVEVSRAPAPPSM